FGRVDAQRARHARCVPSPACGAAAAGNKSPARDSDRALYTTSQGMLLTVRISPKLSSFRQRVRRIAVSSHAKTRVSGLYPESLTRYPDLGRASPRVFLSTSRHVFFQGDPHAPL